MLTSGRLLGERYRLRERIAGGGMGDVWLATDTVLARTVAVKVLGSHGAGGSTFGARFRAEARTVAALRHPGVVEVYDYGEGGGSTESDVAYLVMAYVDGEPLSARLAAGGSLPAEEAMAVVAQAADALAAAHAAGVVHRDVKPGNLLIRPDGSLVLVDFGVARATGATALTGSNEVVGTALYMAPEQVTQGEITPATDIYALGVVAYHCLAGHPPFMGPNPLTVAVSHLNDQPPPLPSGIAAPVAELVARAMAKAPADRFPDATALARAARSAIADPATEPVRAGVAAAAGAPAAEPASTHAFVTPPGMPPPRAGGAHPARRLAAAAAAAALLGLAALAVVLMIAQPASRAPGTDRAPDAPPPSAATGEPTRPAAGEGGGPTAVPTSGPGAARSAGATGPARGPAPATPSAGAGPTDPPSGDPPAPTSEPTVPAEPTQTVPAETIEEPA